MDEDRPGKNYKIGQAAKLLDVKPFVLRFWESEFKDVLVPVRTPAGQRAYSQGNIATVREIKRLLYDEGLTIEGAKKRLGGSAAGAPAHAPLKASATAPVMTPATSGVPPQAPPKPAPAGKPDAMLAEIARELAAIRALLD
jgi:DNA-binding transcriptional MerR regulator